MLPYRASRLLSLLLHRCCEGGRSRRPTGSITTTRSIITSAPAPLSNYSNLNQAHGHAGISHAHSEILKVLVMKKLKKKKKQESFSESKLSTAETNRQIVSRILGLSPSDVSKVPKKLINEDAAKAVYTILQKEEFGKGQVLEHLRVLMLSSSAVENYIEIMKESLFSTIQLPMIIRFSSIHKQGLGILQKKSITPTRAELVKNYCRILAPDNGSDSIENELWRILPVDMDRLSLVDLRKYTIGTYIAQKMNEDASDINRIVLKYPRLENRCLKWVKCILDILLNELEFPKDKIQKHIYLLHGSAHNMGQIVKEVKTLSGIPLKKLVHSRPKILMTSSSSLLEIENCFNEHRIPRYSIEKYPEIFTLSAKTVRQRLEELDQIPEFIPLKSHPRVARLLYYQNKAKARIEHFRSLDIGGASLHLLSADTKRFKNQLALGEMKNRGTDVVNFLADYLEAKWSPREVRDNLMRHPHWLHATVVTVKESLQFIDSFQKFSKEQVFSALPLVLYPKEKIEKEFENVVVFKEADMNDEWFLHMVLYFLERFVHFSGDAMWSLKGDMHDEDDRETAVDESSDASDSEESDGDD